MLLYLNSVYILKDKQNKTKQKLPRVEQAQNPKNSVLIEWVRETFSSSPDPGYEQADKDWPIEQDPNSWVVQT